MEVEERCRCGQSIRVPLTNDYDIIWTRWRLAHALHCDTMRVQVRKEEEVANEALVE